MHFFIVTLYKQYDTFQTSQEFGGGRKKRSTRMRGGASEDLRRKEYLKTQRSLLNDIMLNTKNVRRRSVVPTPVDGDQRKNKFKARNDSLLVSSGQGVNDTSSISGAEYLTNK